MFRGERNVKMEIYWNHSLTCQTAPKIAKDHRKLGEIHGTRPPSEFPERTKPAQQLGFRLLASRAMS